MQGLIEGFTGHLQEAISIGKKAEFKTNSREISNVVVCGLGGSGISGTIVSKIIANEMKIPINCEKGYHLPAYVGESTLVVCCSYSGNTEETLGMYEQAARKGAEIAIATSGGDFKKIAEAKGHNHLIIPGGLPPRAAFGLAFPQLFFVLNKYGLISDGFISAFENGIALIEKEESATQNKAKELADFLFKRIPILYGESRWEGMLVRFRQQLNENSKMLAWHNVIPELNHNELVGWSEKYQNLSVVLYRDEEDFYRNQERFKYSRKVIEGCTDHFMEIETKGSSFIGKSLYLIHLNDWASFYLAEKKNIDSVEVDVISGLKDMLADLK